MLELHVLSEDTSFRTKTSMFSLTEANVAIVKLFGIRKHLVPLLPNGVLRECS